MNRYLRIGGIVAAMVVTLVIVGQAQAAFVIDGNTISGTLGDWIAAGSVQQQDKCWTYQCSSILPTSTPITFSVETLGNGTDIHTLAIGDIDYALSGATLNYEIHITNPNNGGLNNFFFQNATLDTATVGVGTSVVKNFYGVDALPFLTLTSTDGSAQTSTIGGQLTTICIRESWTVALNGDINQTFNTFTEGAIPEPLSIGVWTLLLACVGIGVHLRRRRQTA